jgi:hypothetical protein
MVSSSHRMIGFRMNRRIIVGSINIFYYFCRFLRIRSSFCVYFCHYCRETWSIIVLHNNRCVMFTVNVFHVWMTFTTTLLPFGSDDIRRRTYVAARGHRNATPLRFSPTTGAWSFWRRSKDRLFIFYLMDDDDKTNNRNRERERERE